MRKISILILLGALSTAAIFLSHYYYWPEWGWEWTRPLIAAPIVYAGLNFRRLGAITVSLILLIAQSPIVVIHFARDSKTNVEHIAASVVISIVCVMLGHVLRKERENSETLEYTHKLIRSMRRNLDEDSLLATLEKAFSERGKSKDVSIYLFDESGALRIRNNPSGEPLPPGHLFYAVAEKNELIISSNPAQDPRLFFYGPEKERLSIFHLAVFPLEYGGRAHGVISIANSTDENFEKETIASLTAMKKSVENTLSLSEKLRGKIHHEMRRNKIRETFSSYLSRTVAEEILKNPDHVDLGGEARDVTVMFTEITNFRELMKTVPPAELLAQLNEFFAAAIDTIFEYDGTLDKFIGDNIMAFWGAPLAIPDGEHKAVACALKLHKKLNILNDSWKRDGAQTFNICVGINSGSAIAGNIGSIRRMEYTIIGSVVNLAARIKSLSHEENIPILVSETTRAKTIDSFNYSEPFQAVIKGKSKPAVLCRLIIDND